MRLFVALDIPGAIRVAIQSLIRDLKPFDNSWKWVRAENLHVTLKFLGEVAAQKLPEVVRTLRTVRATDAMTLRFHGLGFFPNERRPRVLWIGMAAPAELPRLASDIDAAFADIGFAREEREFSPHLTLARSKAGTISAELRDAITKNSARQLGTMDASTFHLVESRIKSAGPEYTTLESFSFTH